MILIDSNVLIDLFGVAQNWQDWSRKAIQTASLTEELVVNQINVAEVAPYLGSLEKFRENVEIIGAQIVAFSDEAAFAAGSAFDQYRRRRRSGAKAFGSVLPDFLIGGHAKSLGATIMTRDPRFYRSYFPSVPLITPDKAIP